MTLRKENEKHTARTVLALFAALGLHGVALAQAVTPAQLPAPQTPAPATTPPVLPPPTLSPQLAGKTPPTPLPTEAPKSETAGVRPSDVKPTAVFNGQTPGQPLPGDPAAIHTLEDAIATAFRRSPTILQSQERALKTVLTVDQLLAVKKPQISATASYARLANGSSGAGGGGVSPAQITNPFGVGLSVTPPGTVPIQLSTTSGTSGGVGAGSAGGSTGALTTSTVASNVSTSSSASQVTSGAGRSEPLPPGGSEITRQTTGTGSTGTGTTTPGGGTGSTFSSGANLNSETARITVSQLIDITGVVKTAEQIGNLEEALSRLELARVRQQTALDVKTAYYSLMRALAFVRVNEAAVAQSSELLRVTQAQLGAGVASQFDVLRAQTQRDNNQQALISSRNQVNIAKNALANAIGVDPSTPVDPVEPPVPPAPTLDEDALIRQALAQRPEYLEADVNLLVAQKSIRLAHRNLEPYLDANLSGGYNPNASAFSSKSTASVGVTLTVPLYDGGATRAAIDAARSDQRGALIQKDQFVRGIKAEVQQSIIAVRDADERSRAIAATVVQATEALRLANVRFRAGVGTQLDVNDAQTALVQAQSNQVNAQYDFLGALARLSRSIGNPE